MGEGNETCQAIDTTTFSILLPSKLANKLHTCSDLIKWLVMYRTICYGSNVL